MRSTFDIARAHGVEHDFVLHNFMQALSAGLTRQRALEFTNQHVVGVIEERRAMAARASTTAF